MLTETEARELLARAAETIDVGPGEPVTSTAPVGRRWWPVVAAAAAALVVVATVVQLQRDDSSDRQPATPPTAGPGSVPSVFAYDQAAATQLLESIGLEVVVQPLESCLDSGRAVRTRPAVGTPFVPGDEVILVVTVPSRLGFCALPDAPVWPLLDFANDRGAAPRFASQVTVFVDGVRTELSGSAAGDRANWNGRSALGALAAASAQVWTAGGETAAPDLTTEFSDGDPPPTCGAPRLPAELAARDAFTFWISIPGASGPGAPPCITASLFKTGGAVDAIVVRTGSGPGVVSPPPFENPDPDGIAARFLAFARGESDSLPVDTPVRLYLGDVYQKTISASDALDRGAWDVCDNYAERSCPMSAIATLRQFDADPSVTDVQPEGCVNWQPDPPTDTGGTRFAVLGNPEPQGCSQDFAVQIWSNDVGQITAVNLLLGSP